MKPDTDPGKVIKIDTGYGPEAQFWGEEIGSVSMETDDSLRWLEIYLYKMTDGTRRYVVHKLGKSLIYHALGGPCARGTPVTPGDARWPEDAEPCSRCHPGDWRDGGLFDLETDRHTVYVCDTASEAVERLKVTSRGRPGDPPVLTEPGRRVIEIARRRDPEIAAAAGRAEWH